MTFKNFYIFLKNREKKQTSEGEGNIHRYLLLPLLGMEPTTPACALTRNPTSTFWCTEGHPTN